MTETMTLDEKLAISNKACALFKAGDEEGYSRLMRTIPSLQIAELQKKQDN